MSFLKTSILCVMFWVFLSPVSVFAQTHNHEAHYQKKITSPFETKKENKPLHCLLKFHAKDEICPHFNSLHDKSVPVAIASDCGGKTSGGLPSVVSLNYDFTEATSVPLITNGLKSAFTFDQFPSYHLFNKPVSPPPRNI